MRRSRSLLIMLVVMLAFSPLSVQAEGKNTNTINYVALGDSLAAGVLSDGTLGYGYVEMIKSDLKNNGYEVNVHNKGVPGATSGDVLARLSGIDELADADIITISAGANDILAGLKPILDSGVNLSDLTLEKLAELQQEAGVAAGVAASAKNGASKEISELLIEETKTAVEKVEEAVTSADLEIFVLRDLLVSDPEKGALLDATLNLIPVAKDSVGKAEADVNAARAAFDTNTQEVVVKLESSVRHLEEVAEKLNIVVTNITMIEPINAIVPIPNILSVKTKANEASVAANSAKTKVESTKLAVITYNEAKAKSEAAQLKVKTTAAALAKLAEIPGIIENIGVNTGKTLGAIRAVNPTAKIYVMGYYNALPYLSSEVQESMTKQMLDNLNEAIEVPTTKLGATFVPVAKLFEGNHLKYLPNPTNIHPSEAGYRALANAFMAQINVAFPVVTEPTPNEQEIDLGEEILVKSDELIRIKGTNVHLLLPDNLPEGTKLTVTNTSEDTLLKAEESNLKSFGDALNFKFKYPEGSEDYEGGFTLLMGYDADSPDNIAIYHFNEVDGKWEIQQGEKNKELHAISLDVTHFSNYGVFAQVEKQTPPVTKDPVDNPEDDGGTPPPVAKDPSKGPKDDGKKDTKKNTSKGKLPKTATNYYNLLLIGASLFMSGVIVFIFTKRRHLVMEK